MKKSRYALCLIAIAMLAVGCNKKVKETEVEVDSRGIPTSVAQLLMGDSCRIDTLYSDESNVIRYINNSDFAQRIIFDNRGLVAYNPTFSVDSVTGSIYRVADLVKEVEVDLADPKGLDDLKKAFPLYTDFDIVTYSQTRTRPQSLTFAMSVSVPTNKIQNAEAISQWLAADIDTLPFDGSFRNYGTALANDFFNEFPETVSPFPLNEMLSSLAYWMTSKYVTYFQAFSMYTGGAHGIYGYTFPTYLYEDNEHLTAEYMFRPESYDDIRELLYKALSEDVAFATNHNINNPSQARKIVEDNVGIDGLRIPDPGLLDEGVVFCFQPYEISSYADGSFQLLIPYSKLAPYMTEKGKRLIR